MQRPNLIFFLVLSTCIAIATQSPTLAGSKPIKSYIIDGQGGKLLLFMTCTRESGSNVNIRSGVGKNYKVIRKVESGTPIEVTREVQGNDSFIWNKVTYKGSVGWIRHDYLCDVPYT